MKYIRTKDGIFKCIWEITEINGKNYINMQYDRILYREEILNQADTIEELCYELVFDNVYHSRMTPSAMHTKENQEVIKSYLKQNIVCYGAIWTEWGLKYVAKMNEKGELELL